MKYPTILSARRYYRTVVVVDESWIAVEADEHAEQYDDEPGEYDRIRRIGSNEKPGISNRMGECDHVILVDNRFSRFDDVGADGFAEFVEYDGVVGVYLPVGER